jgi:outer membrane protein assembly factor BamB
MAENEMERRGFTGRPVFWRLAMAVAVIAGAVSIAVAALLIANYLQITAMDPIDNAELQELRDIYAQSAETDPERVREIRVMDLLARKAFFTSQQHLVTGGYILFGSVIVLLIALKLAARWKPQPPEPAETPDAESYWTEIRLTKELSAFAGLVLVICALLAAYLTPLAIPGPGPAPAANRDAGTAEQPGSRVSSHAESGTQSGDDRDWPDWETLQQHWPSFRGPGNYGVAHYTTAPETWNVESGGNLLWKVETPLGGFNSPVVWDQHLFISGATAEKREVYCYDTETGELRWTSTLAPFPGTPGEAPDVSPETGHAAATMVVHGDRACAIFANGDLACLDFEGKLIWGKNLGVPENHYGHSSSLIAWENLLFVQYDQNEDGKLFAFDLASGDEVWSVPREEISWASPAIIQPTSEPQLILNSETDVTAYRPATGELIWKEDEALDGEVAPSPAWAGGMVLCANEYAMASAIRLDTGGDAVSSGIAWQYDFYLPEVASPVGTDKHFYIATSMGEVVCLAHADGKEVYVEEFNRGFYSSPVLVGDRIYLADRDGLMRVFETGDTWKVRSEIELGETAFATPAFLDGRIYLRTEKHLLGIGNTDE